MPDKNKTAVVAPLPSKQAETTIKKEKPVNPDGMTALIYNPERHNPIRKAASSTWSVFSRDEKGTLKSENFVLAMGVNIFPTESVSRFKNAHPNIFDGNIVEEVADISTLQTAGGKSVSSLLGFHAPGQAERIASLEKSRDTLNRWLNEETRPKVVRAINARLSSLTNASNPL